MHDLETQKKFVALRSLGRSYDRIAAELNVSRQTLINWSRKFQFEIHNLRAIEMESLQHTLLASREEQLRALGDQLKQVEAEIKNRNVADLTTTGLLALARRLRHEILAATGTPKFSISVKDIPNAEYVDQVQDWSV